MRRSQTLRPGSAGDAAHRDVYDGLTRAGSIMRRGEHWSATTADGREVGTYETSVEAVRALLRHHAAARAAH